VRVLIDVVDDDAAVRDALCSALTLEGLEVRGFGDAQTFLKAVALRRPDAVLLDVHMPGRSGIDVLRALRTDTGRKPAIMMISGQADIATAVEAVKLGADDFIEKPFDLDEVVRKLHALLGDQRGEGRLGSLSSLSRREIEIIDVIATGASSKEAGQRLGISPRTVDAHRARIIDKLGVKNTAELMRLYFTASGRG
jgi:FixJ family two-component response regulator